MSGFAGAAGALGSGISATPASVVTSSEAIEEALRIALLVT